MASKQVTVYMHGGPADGKIYKYPNNATMPETLVIQGRFGDTFKVVDYQRKPGTYHYYAKDGVWQWD